MVTSKLIFFLSLSLTLVLGILTITELAYGQNQDFSISCPSCVDIPPEEISLYKELFPLIIWTEESVLDHNSKFNVNGFIRPENAFHPITITVTNPIGNIVTVEQITPSPNGDFAIDFNTASELWNKDGKYIIKAQSGSETRTFKISVDVIAQGKQPVVGCSVNEFPVDDHCIPYTITWAKIVSAKIDPNEKSLTINIESMNRGEITITPSSDIIRGVFMVLVDGEESNNFSIDDNTISIPFENGAKKIEILATFVVPEFGTIASMILVLSLAFILIWSRKSFGIPTSNFLKK